MSVITNTQATPNRLETICRYLAYAGDDGVIEADLPQLLSPPAARHPGQATNRRRGDGDDDDSTVARNPIAESVALKLVDRTADGHVRLAAGVRTESSDAFRDFLARILLDPDEAKDRGQERVGPALAWFLEQDSAKPLRFDQAGVKGIIEEQFGKDADDFDLTNRARWQQFTYWARYLGYAWRVAYSDAGTYVLPDPTEALARILEPELAERQELRIHDAIATWADRSPVLDGGVARTSVRERVRGGSADSSTRLSRSTSLALRRLEHRGLFHLEHRPDSATVVLSTWPRPKTVSHLIRS